MNKKKIIDKQIYNYQKFSTNISSIFRFYIYKLNLINTCNF